MILELFSDFNIFNDNQRKQVSLNCFLIKVKLFEALRLRLIETTFNCFSISFKAAQKLFRLHFKRFLNVIRDCNHLENKLFNA